MSNFYRISVSVEFTVRVYTYLPRRVTAKFVSKDGWKEDALHLLVLIWYLNDLHHLPDLHDLHFEADHLEFGRGFQSLAHDIRSQPMLLS